MFVNFSQVAQPVSALRTQERRERDDRSCRIWTSTPHFLVQRWCERKLLFLASAAAPHVSALSLIMFIKLFIHYKAYLYRPLDYRAPLSTHHMYLQPTADASHVPAFYHCCSMCMCVHVQSMRGKSLKYLKYSTLTKQFELGVNEYNRNVFKPHSL